MSLIHRLFFGFMRLVIAPYFFLTGYRWKKYRIKSKTALVLTNHNTNWDFFLFGLLLNRHQYYVASEHIYRLGFTSKIIKFLGDPIPRKKGAAADETVAAIKDRLHRGFNVCMMAEGNRSYHGETGFISRNTAVLAKECGAGLITLTIGGGFFRNPRWSEQTRKGRTWGQVVREYSPEELQAMSVDQVYEAICRDLYVDAYADQETRHFAYRCKAPAENLECALFHCPSCHSLTGMASSGRRFTCRQCGLSLQLDDYGYFEKDPASSADTVPFTTIRDWFRDQVRYLRDYLPSLTDSQAPLFSDEGMTLRCLTVPKEGASSSKSAKTASSDLGALIQYPDRLTLRTETKTVDFPLNEITRISIALRDTILFTFRGDYYEIKHHSDGASVYCALKYLICTRLLSGKDYR